MTPDEHATAIRPTAAALIRAVEQDDPAGVATLLHRLDRQQLYALAVILAAHVDVPVCDRRRSPEDIDHALTARILGGDPTGAEHATRAERAFVAKAWRNRGRPLAELERLTGWSRLWAHARTNDEGAA